MSLRLQAGNFYGVTSKTIEAAGFRFTEKAYEPLINLPDHAHELSHFCFVLEGRYTESLCQKSEERRSASLVFYPPDSTHAENHHIRGRHFLIEVDSWRVNRLSEIDALPVGPLALKAHAAGFLATRLYREFHEADDFSLLSLEGLMLELLAETGRGRGRQEERKAPRWLNQAREILRELFAEPPGLDDLADRVGVHPVHLARVFRQFYHCTIGDYVRLLRVEHACKKLSASDDPLVQIALDSGFADQTHFTRSFKRVTGMTPGEYRVILRNR